MFVEVTFGTLDYVIHSPRVFNNSLMVINS